MNDELSTILKDVHLSNYVGEKCEICGHKFESLEDFKDKDPRRWFGEGMKFACNKCFEKTDKTIVVKLPGNISISIPYDDWNKYEKIVIFPKKLSISIE